jgi:hypothetical protein
VHHPSPPIGRCLICGRPLGEAESWVTAHPDGEHTHCRDWSAAPFPFEHDLAELRKVARVLLATYRQVVEVGKWLAALQQRWPTGAKRGVHQYQAKKIDLRERLVRAVKVLRF